MNEAQLQAIEHLQAQHPRWELGVDMSVRVTFQQNHRPFDYADYTIDPDGNVTEGHGL